MQFGETGTIALSMLINAMFSTLEVGLMLVLVIKRNFFFFLVSSDLVGLGYE